MVAIYAISTLCFLGYINKIEVAGSIAAVAMGVAAANSYQKKSVPEK